jgi:hypothetical protein
MSGHPRVMVIGTDGVVTKANETDGDFHTAISEGIEPV